jgi:YHS domain-containing protein
MKIFKAIVLVVVFAMFSIAVFAHEAGEMKCGNMSQCKMMDMSNCPFCVKGAVVKVVNTGDGVQISVTSGNKDTIKEIQEKSAKFTASCAAKPDKAVAAPGVKESTLDGNPDDMVQCPVMGTKFKKKDAYKVYEYKGEKYYLCCPMCDKPFNSDPDKYTK